MTDAIAEALSKTPVVPLVQSNDPETALEIARALVEGGLTVLEVVLRTDEAVECLRYLAAELPGAHIGAGTVLDVAQAEKVIDCGAQFVVAPGLDPDVIRYCQSQNTPVFPGIATATELTAAYNLGLRIVKFFPASLSGGPKMIQALASVFRDVQFMPTGGIRAENLSDFLEVPSVIGCGGSWLTPAAEIEAGNFAAITTLAQEAVALAAAHSS